MEVEVKVDFKFECEVHFRFADSELLCCFDCSQLCCELVNTIPLMFCTNVNKTTVDDAGLQLYGKFKVKRNFCPWST